MRARRFIAGLTLLLLTACGGGGASQPALVVGVASSMTEAVRALADTYRAATVELSIAGSQVLVAQVREGAPLDVVITADANTARALSDLGVVNGVPVLFAHNRLAIAVTEGNPLGIAGLDDLDDERLTLVLAAPQVPAGAYTEELLRRAGVSVAPSSFEPSVRAVLAKIQLGEADAGIVYQTDLELGGVSGVEIPEDLNLVTGYFAAALRVSAEPGAAADFVAFLRSSEAQAILANLGFRP